MKPEQIQKPVEKTPPQNHEAAITRLAGELAAAESKMPWGVNYGMCTKLAEVIVRGDIPGLTYKLPA
jgi:hypothetical protein